MRFFWMRDADNKNKFYMRWNSGAKNLADHFTKYHPDFYHKQMWKIFISSCLIGTIVKDDNLLAYDRNYLITHEGVLIFLL